MKWQQCSEWGNNDVLKNLDWISSVLLLLKCSYELEFAKILPKKICIFCLLYQKCKSESSFFYTWQFLQIRPQNTPILTTVNNPFFAEFLIYGEKTANKLFLPQYYRINLEIIFFWKKINAMFYFFISGLRDFMNSIKLSRMTWELNKSS